MTPPYATRRPATRAPIRAIHALLTLTSALIWIASPVSAGTSAPSGDGGGVDGFAICGTFDPTSSYYVPGDPVYLSDIFQVKRDSPNYELAFKNFLKQKYGWTKYVTCSVSYAQEGATKTFNEKLKQAGAHLVRTGWTLASAGASAGTDVASGAGSAAAPAAPPDPAAGNSYWVCRVSGSNGKDYNSEIFRGSDAGFSTFPAVFGQFVQSKYNVKFLSTPTCTNYGVLGRHQAIEALQGYASYSTGVMTGWKYGTAAGTSSAPSQPAAAPASSAQNAGGRMYWVCSWAYRGSYYVSDAFGADYPAVGPGLLVPAFQNYVVAKYGAKPYGGSCVYKFSEADAQAMSKRELSSPPGGMKAVATGWRYGMTASAAASPAAGAAAAAAPHAAPEPASAPAHSEPALPVATNITVRLVDAVHASGDQPNKRYRAVVTQAATAGSVQIPANTLAAITVVQQSGGHFSTQLVSLKINGQDTPVTSTALNATSASQEAVKKIGGLLSSIGKHGAAAQISSATDAVGNHGAIQPGTTLTFSTSIPQPDPSTATAVPLAQASMPASAGAQQGGGELGPDGQVIGGTTSGVMIAYSCYVQTIPEGQHRQTTYVTAPFSSAQPQRWITFWFSQHIHQTYNIPANIARFTIDCGSLGNKSPVQQQAIVNANITSWKQHDNDVVQLHWAPTHTPTPGISVAQLNPMTGEMTTGGIGSNMPAASNPAGSVVLCDLPAVSGTQYISAVFPAGNHQHADLDIAFENYASTHYNNGKVLGDATCLIVTQTHAQAILLQWKKDFQNAGTPVVETGWTYKGPEAGPVATAQPNPTGYVLCTTNRSSDSKAYTSAIFRGSNDQQLAMGQAFLTYMATNFGPNVPHNTSCVAYQDLADAQRYLYAMKNQAPGAGITVVETGWTYSGAGVATSSGGGGSTSEQASASGGQHVLCYSDTYQGSFYLSANFHIDVPPPPDPHSTQTDNGRSANALNELKTDFLAFLKKQYGFRVASAYPVYCDGRRTASGPDEERQLLHQRFPQLKMIETGWKPGAAPPPLAANASAAPATPFSSVGGVYTGTYTCAKGPVDMKLTLSLNEHGILTGTMTFYLPPGSHTKAYTFSLGGPLNQTSGSFNLRPSKWETPAPPNYVMVGLNGTANPQTGKLSGTVDYAGCGKFEAMKGRED
jgi:hypothetical protein